MRRLGIVDIGSNTIRLAVFARQSSGGFRLHDDVRERVRLGAGVDATGRIEDARLARAKALLEQFADYGRGARLDDLEVFGTSALRDAENGHELIEHARDLGLAISILSGEQEARLGVLAVANRFDLDDGWVLDLGGGSAQLSRMEDRRYVFGGAHPLGAVRLSERYLKHDPPTREDIERLEGHVEGELAELAEAMRGDSGPLLVIGGAVRNLARAVQIEGEYPLDLLHGYWFRRRDLESVTESLLTMDSAGRAAMRGINRERGDVIHAAALVFRWLLRASERRGLLVSGGGVREGALYRHVLRTPYLVPRLAQSAIRGLVEEHVIDRDHAESVHRCALAAFDRLAGLLSLVPRDRILLGAAAWLHESGLSIDFYRRQKHSAFLLQSKSIDGFTHREQVLIMLLVRYHRKRRVKVDGFESMLAEDDSARLAGLHACLRLGIALDRSRGGRIDRFELTTRGSRVVLEVAVEDEGSIELRALRDIADDVAEVLGRSFEIVPLVHQPPKRDPRMRPVYEGD